MLCVLQNLQTDKSCSYQYTEFAEYYTLDSEIFSVEGWAGSWQKCSAPTAPSYWWQLTLAY